MTVYSDDKRLIGDSEHFVVERVSERDWHECRYCYRATPTFILTEYLRGTNSVGQMRCCWECGSGLERLTQQVTQP